jgi:glycosyltransferase involved in cell wall biosynthesis
MESIPDKPPLLLPESSEQPSLSVVIPAYNEAARILNTLTRIHEYLFGSGWRFELVIIDDGSRDDTVSIIRDFARRNRNVRLIINPRNRGKGFAVRQGMLVATGELVLMCDADLSTPIEELEQLLPCTQRGCHVVIGSRDLPDSRLDPAQPARRRRLAAIFRTLRRLLLLPRLRDTQCGFKLFRHDAARAIFTRQRTNGWLFDCEALGLADRLGYRIQEIGVHWQDNPDSRVRLLPAALAALPTLLLIRLRLLKAR